MITRFKALTIIANYGWLSDSLTLYDPVTDTMVAGSSFDDEFGIKAEYSLRSIMHWLGY